MTNLKKVMEIVKIFCNGAPLGEPKVAGIMQHPLIESNMLPIPKDELPEETKGIKELGDMVVLMIDEDNKQAYLDWRYKILEKAKDVHGIICHIRKPDRIVIFQYIKEFLSEKDYNILLRNIWEMTEFPHQNSILILKDLFDNAKPELLMDKEEKKVYDDLPDEIVIYRGLQGDKAKVQGLSWTLDYDKAKWFSKRFGNKGKVYRTIIKKADIYCYLDGRNEKEMVVNPIKIRKATEVKNKNAL